MPDRESQFGSYIRNELHSLVKAEGAFVSMTSAGLQLGMISIILIQSTYV